MNHQLTVIDNTKAQAVSGADLSVMRGQYEVIRVDVPSNSTQGVIYPVTIIPSLGFCHCPCKGFSSHRHCSHLGRAALASGLVLDDEQGGNR